MRAGGLSPRDGESRIPPICQSTTFFYGDTKTMADLFDLKGEGYFYSRLANPTVAALENKLAALEGGIAGIGCSSGMSATLLTAATLCEAGDNIVCAQAVYGGTFNLFGTTLPKLGIGCRFFDPDAAEEEIDKLIDDKTRLIFAETVANPAIIVLDFEKIARIARGTASYSPSITRSPPPCSAIPSASAQTSLSIPRQNISTATRRRSAE